jgi:hypothetical protein
MSKPPDEIDAVLVRIRTLKWQAVSVVSSSNDGLARQEAASVIATLDGIASSMRKGLAPEAVKAAQERLDALCRLRDHAPLRKAAGRA